MFKANEAIFKASGVAASLMTTRLGAMLNESGRFQYAYNLDQTVDTPEDYNWLRHFGAIYSLLQAYEMKVECPYYDKVRHALSYAEAHTFGPVEEFDERVLGVWSRPEHERYLEANAIKTGGVGLALLVFSKATKLGLIDGSSVAIGKLAAYLLEAQKDDGSFYSFFFEATGFSAERKSLYYPGEAALGLIECYKLTRNTQYLQVAQNALLYLEQSRRTNFTLPPDHWALIATAAIMPFVQGEQKLRVSDHARRVTQEILHAQIVRTNSVLHGSFSPDGRTTPTSARLEGLNASAVIFEKDETYRSKLLEAIELGIAFLARSTFADGRHAGAVPGAIARRTGDSAADRDFNQGATEVRIDYIQHALSACLGYRSNIDYHQYSNGVDIV